MDKIEAVFFDRGNTTNNCIIGPSDDEQDIIRNKKLHESFNSLFNTSVDINQLTEKIILPWKSTFPDRDSRGYEIRLENYITGFLDENEISYNHADIYEIIMNYGSPHIEWDIPNDGIIELFQHIKGKGIKIGILSNSAMHGDIYRRMYDSQGLSQYIDDYVFSYDIDFRKPDKTIFLYACKRLSVFPENCIMVGDKIEKDIIGAKQAGMKTVWYNFGNRPGGSESDWEINHFNEMIDII